MLINLGLEMTRINAQLEEFRAFLKVNFPDHRVCEFQHLRDHLVIGKRVTTVGAGEPQQVLIHCWLGAGFEKAMTALRANERDNFIHALEGIS
jgi:hypothetical protein